MVKVKLMELDVRTGFDTGVTQYIHKNGAKVTEHAVSDIIEIELYDILHKIPITCSAQRFRIHLEKETDFSTYCTLKRDVKLVIPCEIEVSRTSYAGFEKVKM